MNARVLYRSLQFGLGLLLATSGVAIAQPMPGECASGFCGTPKNNGGGGCGCGGGSILVNNTDIGQTYSTSDDYDADGLEDDFDNCPFVANRDQADGDGDKIGNVCDNCAQIANADQHDVNLNNMGDACDTDIDGDTIANVKPDNCPAVPNVLQLDTDGDGIGDVCDPDMDGDGVLNRADNCPLVANPGQEKNAPGMYGDRCDVDTDKDSFEDAKDNCPANYNPDQLDNNSNGTGDVCDADVDGDKITNQYDNCPALANTDQKDADKDGVGDVCQTHGFCFVASKNSIARCLDPKSVFMVTAGPAAPSKFTGMRKLQTGTAIPLNLYANRENVAIQYTWTVTSQPEGATVTVEHPRGTVNASEAYEFHYTDAAQWPTLTASHPGTYVVHLSADLAKPDAQFPGVVHAESDVEIQVDGPISGAAGCGLGGRSAAGSSMALMGLVVAAGALLRRRRRA